MNLKPSEINWIANEKRSGRTIEEIAIDTGMSKQNVKRALAESGDMVLSWYKTKEENLMLEFLRNKGITKLNQLTNMI